MGKREYYEKKLEVSVKIQDSKKFDIKIKRFKKKKKNKSGKKINHLIPILPILVGFLSSSFSQYSIDNSGILFNEPGR